MLQVQCPGCMTQAFLECTCPPGFLASVGTHHDGCSHSDIDANLICAPGSDCCAEDHDHAAAASACPGSHDDAKCPEKPGQCGVWRNMTADARHPLYSGGHPLLGVGHQPGDDIPDCPGGHCHKDVKGCTVCRPLVITVLPGGATIQPVAG